MKKLKFIEPEIIQIPEGNFFMGSKNGTTNEIPVHSVWLDSYGVAKYPVTNREYAIFVEVLGHSQPPFWKEPKFRDSNQPVVGTSWYDAVAYCDWLSGLTGKNYHLPTEAEREKAARGGLVNNLYPWGNNLPADHLGGLNAPHLPIGTEGPNGYGLYNMSEGVHEWCADWYNRVYYAGSPNRNPTGPQDGHRRVARGGSWRHLIRFARCAARSSLAPEKQFNDFGFRSVVTMD